MEELDHKARADAFFREVKSSGVTSFRGLRAKIYVRVSDTRNREETLISPEVQIGHCMDWARREGVEVIGTEEDLNVSGKSFAKRKISKMIAEVKDGEYEVVIVWKWSRWGRNLQESMINMALLDEVGGTLIAATEPVDVTTPTGVFSRTQFLAIAQLQLDQIRESWRDAHRTRLGRGLPHCGPRPFGYEYHPEEQDPAKKYTADPHEFPVIQEIFASYIGGKSPHTIARDLNSRGIMSRNGKPWNPAKIRDVMRSGFAAGRITYGQYEAFSDLWPHAITREQWDAYLRVKGDRGKEHPRRAGQLDNPLRGMVFCARCGRLMNLQRVKSRSGWGDRSKVYEYNYWRCTGPQNWNCKGNSLAEATMLKKVEKWLVEKVKGGDDAPEMVERKMRSRKATSDAKAVERELATVRALKKKARSYLMDGTFTKEEYAEEKAGYDAQIADLEASLQTLRTEAATNAVPPSDVFNALLLAFRTGMDPEGLRHTLSAAIWRIEVVPSKETEAGKGTRTGKAAHGRQERIIIRPDWERPPAEVTT